MRLIDANCDTDAAESDPYNGGRCLAVEERNALAAEYIQDVEKLCHADVH